LVVAYARNQAAERQIVGQPRVIEMALTRRGERCHGESQADIREELLRYSQVNGHRADYFAECKCACGGRVFQLELDDNEGAAVRHCIACSQDHHPIGDSADFLDDADLEECACPCGADGLEITVGVEIEWNASIVSRTSPWTLP
jgi:hypothetical protein